MITIKITIIDRRAETGVRFTHAQWDAIDCICDHLRTDPPIEEAANEESEQDRALTSVVMRLCMLVVMQDTSRIPLYESPLMHYLAVRGIDEHSKTFQAAFFYTPVLAAAL